MSPIAHKFPLCIFLIRSEIVIPTPHITGQTYAQVHVMHRYSEDFYGQRMRVVALGYLRPEMRFPGGIGELIARIKADVAIANVQLSDVGLQEFKNKI